ncbi:uncharacterized protein C8R40DRAFT_1032809, partial [Lentinula edodes]|uniref:uncharacterized protein n=1 Tax=Lentinula edodes TaxID=5353 RepID=UPI001E8CD8B7
IRRVFLIVRDTLKTQLNPFRLYRLYPHRPTFDPDAFVSLDDLAKDPRTHSVPLPSMSQSPDAGPCYEPPWPFKNMSIWRLMRWSNTGSSLKSEGEVTRLVKEVIATDDFNVDDLRGFNAHRENQRADKTSLTSGSLNSYLAGFCTTAVDIQVPSGQKNVPSATFSVPGLHYRPLLSVIKEAFSSPLSMSMHLSPFKLFHQLPNSEVETRVHGELYSSDSFINMHDKIQRTPLPPDESDCKLERVVAAVMLWSFNL